MAIWVPSKDLAVVSSPKNLTSGPDIDVSQDLHVVLGRAHFDRRRHLAGGQLDRACRGRDTPKSLSGTENSDPGVFHLNKKIVSFPLLVLKGTYHYWTCFFFPGDLGFLLTGVLVG